MRRSSTPRVLTDWENMAFEVPTVIESGMGKVVDILWEDTIIAFVIIQFQFIVGHPHFDIVDAFLHGLYKFTNMMWWCRFSQLRVIGNELWWIEWRAITSEGVWYRRQTEQAPGQSLEVHRTEQEQDQTLSCWWRQFEFCWIGMRGTIAVQYRVYQKHAQDD